MLFVNWTVNMKLLATALLAWLGTIIGFLYCIILNPEPGQGIGAIFQGIVLTCAFCQVCCMFVSLAMSFAGSTERKNYMITFSVSFSYVFIVIFSLLY